MIVDSRGSVPPAVGAVAVDGASSRPAQQGGGATDGFGAPTPPVREDHGWRGSDPTTAAGGVSRAALSREAQPSSTGGGVSFHHPAPRLPRGYSTRFCVTGCNARGRVHINGVCIVCRDFGGDR